MMIYIIFFQIQQELYNPNDNAPTCQLNPSNFSIMKYPCDISTDYYLHSVVKSKYSDIIQESGEGASALSYDY